MSQVCLFEDYRQSEDGGECHIYVLKQGNTIKIGKAKNVAARLKTLQTSSPVKLQLIGSRSGLAKHERELHHLCERDRMSGEWFNLTTRVMAVTAAYLHAWEWRMASIGIDDSCETECKRETQNPWDFYSADELQLVENTYRKIFLLRKAHKLVELIERTYGVGVRMTDVVNMLPCWSYDDELDYATCPYPSDVDVFWDRRGNIIDVRSCSAS